MNAQGPVSDWAPEVIEFLSSTLPREGDSEGWHHMFSTAYQIGCEALVALGYAEETDWGALPLVSPVPPSAAPRWDDICVAVLRLAEQQNKLSYRLADGSPLPPRIGTASFTLVAPKQQQQVPAPTIASMGMMGPAHADCDLLPVLCKLGLVTEGHWADHAETVLWRVQPRAWAMDVLTDPRFVNAAHEAVDTLPSDIRKEIGGLVAISEKDIEASIARHRSTIEDLRRVLGPKARIGRPRTPEETRQSIAFERRNVLDWVFFRRWRLSDGWLTTEQAKSALQVFHDPLATQMRQAVVGHLHPGQPEFAK